MICSFYRLTRAYIAITLAGHGMNRFGQNSILVRNDSGVLHKHCGKIALGVAPNGRKIFFK